MCINHSRNANRAGLFGWASEGDGSKGGDVFHELIGAVFVIYTSAVVLQPIAHYEPFYLHFNIVSANLLEHLLRNLYVWRLVLDDHQWLCVATVYHSIATLLGCTQCDGNFVSDALCRIAFVPNKEMDELLAHPFFGCEHHKPAPQDIENLLLAIL